MLASMQERALYAEQSTWSVYGLDYTVTSPVAASNLLRCESYHTIRMALLSSSEGGDTVNHAGLADAELRNIEYKTIPADP